MNSAGVGKNDRRVLSGLCSDCAKRSPEGGGSGRRARIEERRSRFLGQGTNLFDESKNIRRAVSQVAIDARQFADAIAGSTAARVILVPYWVKAIGVARLDEFRD
jgi:hypothetical protein